MGILNKKKNEQAGEQSPKPSAQGSVLKSQSFMNADNLCDFINEKKIKPFSINVTDRFYMVFYYEN